VNRAHSDPLLPLLSIAPGSKKRKAQSFGRALISLLSSPASFSLIKEVMIGFVCFAKCCIMHEMYRAEVEPMPENQPDSLPFTGLWKVVIYEGERLVRSDREYITHPMAKKLAEDLNLRFSIKTKAKGA
jgi:hypothetical protein